MIKSIIVREVFGEVPEKKKVLWGGESGADGYYFAKVSGRGEREVTRKYILGQGRIGDIKRLGLAEL